MSNDFWQNGKRYNQASGPDADEYARSQGYADFGEWAASDPQGATQWQFQNQPGGQTQVANSDDFDYVRSVVLPLLAAAGGGAVGDYFMGAAAPSLSASGLGTTGITSAQLAALPGAGATLAAVPAAAATTAAVGGTAAAAIPTAGAGVTAPAAATVASTATAAPTTSAVTAGGLEGAGSLDSSAAMLSPTAGSIEAAGGGTAAATSPNWLNKAANAAGGNKWQTAAQIGAGIFGGIQNQRQFDADQQLKQAQLQLQKDELAQRQGNFTAQQAQQQKQYDSTLGQQQGQQALGATQMDPFRQAKAREGQALLSALISGGSLAGALNPSNLAQVQAFASPGAMAANESQFNANAGAASGGKYVGANPNAVGYPGQPRTNQSRLVNMLAPTPYTY